MTAINVASPYALKRAEFIVEDDDYTAHVGQAEFQPSAESGSWTGIGGNVIKEQAATGWTLALGLVQDDAPTGLLRYLFDHDGETKVIRLRPRGAVAGATEWTAEVIITPANIGGTAGNSPATSQVNLPVNGSPVPSAVVVTPPPAA